jgi:2-phospho-L-lactate guanylyltransferase (CobY/MobA/RfbA family)
MTAQPEQQPYRFADPSGDELVVIPGPDVGGGPFITVHADSARLNAAVSVEVHVDEADQLADAIRSAARLAREQLADGPRLTAVCPAALLPLGSAPVERCVTRSKHVVHTSANGQTWTNPPAS